MRSENMPKTRYLVKSPRSLNTMMTLVCKPEIILMLLTF